MSNFAVSRSRGQLIILGWRWPLSKMTIDLITSGALYCIYIIKKACPITIFVNTIDAQEE